MLERKGNGSRTEGWQLGLGGAAHRGIMLAHWCSATTPHWWLHDFRFVGVILLFLGLGRWGGTTHHPSCLRILFLQFHYVPTVEGFRRSSKTGGGPQLAGATKEHWCLGPWLLTTQHIGPESE